MRGPNCSLLTADKCWCVTSKPTLAGDKHKVTSKPTQPWMWCRRQGRSWSRAVSRDVGGWKALTEVEHSTTPASELHTSTSASASAYHCIPAMHITAYQQCISLHTTTCGPTRSYSTYLAKPIGDLAKVLNAASFCIFAKICKTIDRIQKITSNLHILGRHKISAHYSAFCFQNPAQTNLTFWWVCSI